MMDNSLEELKKLFQVFVEAVDKKALFDYGTEDQDALIDYLMFIQETSPFNTILRRIDKPFIISSLYSKLKQQSKGYGGTHQKVFASLTFPSPRELKPLVRTFHEGIIAAAEQAGLKRKKTIILNFTDESICLAGEKPPCYSMKRKGSERWKIIKILFSLTKTGRSAYDIAVQLFKDGREKTVQDNVKKAIKKINEIFQHELSVKHDLITHIQSKNKNSYFLNREHFNFEVEK